MQGKNRNFLSVVKELTCFEKTFVLEKERVLTDHQVMGMAVLPGVVYLEMVVAATRAIKGNIPVLVQDLTFSSPLTVASEAPVYAQLLLEPHSKGTRFQISSQQESSVVEHASGWLTAVLQNYPSRIDIEAVRSRTPRKLIPQDIYTWYNNLGINYGAGFQVIQSLQINQTEGVAVLEAPELLWQNAAGFHLHPAIMDGALQSLGALLGFGLGNQADSLYLPFSIEKVTVYEQVAGRVLAYVRQAETEQKTPGVARGDVCLVSPDGNVLVELQGVRALRKATSHKISVPQATVFNLDLYNSCYKLVWQTEPAQVTPSLEKRTWLIFMDDLGLGAALAQVLHQEGHFCIQVKVGTEFSRLNKQNFCIAPGKAEDYQYLLQAVNQDYPEISGVIYLWSLKSGDFANTNFTQLDTNWQDLTKLLSLAQALTKQQQKPLDLWLITNDSQPVTSTANVLNPDKAALWGMARVISKEYSQLQCHCVDLSLSEPMRSLADLLVQEMKVASASHDVAYRSGERWTPYLVSCESQRHLEEQSPKVRTEGIYLITGGLGGLGGEVAKLLARSGRPYLYLLGRKPLPPESAWSAWLAQNPAQDNTSVRIRLIQHLESLGARVFPVYGDVADLEQMRGLIQSICDRHGTLHGIVHAAGIIKDGLLQNKSINVIKEVLQPKVSGAWVLAQVTQKLNLDFLVFFSSLAALTGNVGQGDYAAANAFLDAYAAYLQQSRPAFSINWGPWSNVGMLQAASSEHIQAMGLEAIVPEEGQQLFDLALRYNSGQWVIFKQAQGKSFGKSTIALNQLRPSKTQSSVQPRTEERLVVQEKASPNLLKLIQSYLLTKIAQTLRLPEEHINPRENFMELGFDSMMAVQVKSSIEKDGNLTLDATLLFEYPSITELAEYLAQEHSETFARVLLPNEEVQISQAEGEIVVTNCEEAKNAKTAGGESQAVVAAEQLVADIQFEEATPRPLVGTAAISVQSVTEETQDIAIIGLSCRFPGASNPAQFWQNLQSGVDAVSQVPSERWDWRKFYDSDRSQPGKTCSSRGGFIKGIEEFDPAFFGISFREALQMDPQQRLFLEVVWESLETAGYLPEQLANVRTGVFVGASGYEYVNVLKRAQRYHDPHTGSGNALSIIANRISYHFNWMGPSLTIDTACSSSLVALNMAYQALRRNEIDVALVGGSNLILTPDGAIIFGQAGMLSKHGKCKTFDSTADGYVRGEGVGAVLLKPLAKAIRDRDNIWAVIKGAGVNHDGHSKASLTAPNPKAQRRLLQEVWNSAGIDPSRLGYIEAHGTGTSLGDPIEIRGLVEAFGNYTKKRGFCAIGTVKSNIGHLEPAAGIAGLLKVVLSLKHQELPPTLHFNSPNPHIVFEDSPFYVNDKLRQWTPEAGTRLAGVSSFGFGGANAHVIVQEAPPLSLERPSQDRPAHVFTLSARSREALERLVERYLDYLDTENGADLRDICFTVNTGRTHFRHRLAMVVRFKDQLADKLYIFSQAKDKTALRRSLIFTDNAQADETALSKVLMRLKQLPAQAQGALPTWCRGSVFTEKILPQLTISNQQLAISTLNADIYVELLTVVAQLYSLGVEVDWETVEAGFVRQRVALPTYPFERQRCWLEEVTVDTVSSSLTDNWKAEVHPMLGKQCASLDGGVFEKHWNQNNSLLLQHHQVNGSAMLPGVSAIELMLGAVRYLQPSKTYCLSQIVFSRPITLSASGQAWTQVLVQKSSQQSLNFHLRGSLEEPTDGFNTWADHANGQLVDTVLTKPRALDISSIAERCPQILPAEEIYRGFETAGLTYGSALQAINQVKVGQQEVLAVLRLPDVWLESLTAYQVHPVLADAALQTLAALVVQPEQPQVLYVPFAIDEVFIYNRLPATVVSWSSLSISPQSQGEILTADVALATQDGEVLVEMKKVRLRRLSGKLEQIGQTEEQNQQIHKIRPTHLNHGGSQPKIELESLLHEAVWEKTQPAVPASSIQYTQHPWLLLVEPNGLGEAVAQQLINIGATVIKLYRGTEFSCPDTGVWTINQQFPQHWQQLAACIQQMQVQDIVHLWTAETINDTTNHDFVTLEQQLNDGVCSLLSLVQALAAQKDLPKGLRLRLVSANSQLPASATCPERAASWGLLKTIALEMPQLQTQAIEVQLGFEYNVQQIAQLLIEEFRCPIKDSEIAYTGTQRWYRLLRPLSTTATTKTKLLLQQRGIYLITGGLGGIGLEIGRWLAQKYQARLILTTRSPFIPELQWTEWLNTHADSDPISKKIHSLREIQLLGSEVIIQQADVADFASMSRLLATIYGQIGKLNGIFHAAGITQDGLLRSKQQETLRTVLQPKVHGTWLLHTLTQQQPPEVMVLFSSVAAMTGNVGQGDYAAANRYLDSFALWRQAQGLPTLSINWGLWGEVGMGKHLAESARARGLAPLSTTDTLAALETALTLLPTHPVVAVLNKDSTNTAEQPPAFSATPVVIAEEVTAEQGSRGVITPVIGSNISPRLLQQQVQEQLIDVMARVLETQPERIDPQQSFLEMGLDSILAIRAVKEIQEQTKSSFPATLLFDYPTVEALATFLSEQPGATCWIHNENEPQTDNHPITPPPHLPISQSLESSTSQPLPSIGVPIVDQLAIQVLKETQLGLSVTLPAKPENLNHIGTIYAGALFCLGEAVAAMALMRALSTEDVNFVVLGVRITYQEMAINEVQCDVYLEQEEVTALVEKLNTQGEALYSCPVPIQDKWGKLVCQLEVDFLLRSKQQAKLERTSPKQLTTKSSLAVTVNGSLPVKNLHNGGKIPLTNYTGTENAETEGERVSATATKLSVNEQPVIADTDMAIIGFSGRFPNAENLDEYWFNLANGVNCIREIPEQRWSVTEYFDPDPQTPGKMYTKWGGFMKSIDEFDPLFFSISPREAESMDPQQRLILETAWEALEMAGYAKDTATGSPTGVFIGVSSAEYARTQLRSPEQVTAAVGLGNSLSIVANRISYQFNLRGPSLVVDTACSSSLVALNTAVRSILQGDCETALVGGVYVILAPESYIFFSKGRFMSPVGQCKTFDSRADGYVRGEGAGVVMIKPLKKALRDRDTIHAVIKSVAVNQDGKSNGLTAPNSRSQVAVLKNAYKLANVNPRTISYIEAHGTGTDLGDPIEINALSEVFGEHAKQRQFCAIGAVKTNIGHLEPAAGVASLIKVILALKHRQIPPTLNFETPNHYINFEDTPFYVNERLRDWEPVDGVRRAGISSFGFGGTNTHVVLEEAPAIPALNNFVERPVHVLTLSARSENTRNELAKRYITYLEKNPETVLSDLCFTANCGRSHLVHRLAVTASSVKDLQTKLEAFICDQTTQGIAVGSWESRKRPPLVFLFTGQGSQTIHMARELYKTQPTFRKTLDYCAALLQPYLGQSLLSVIYPETGNESLLNETAYTQPALFAIEYPLATLWRSYGVEPNVVLGHSVGEYVAACVAGVFSLEDGLRLIARRGQLMQKLPRNGSMAAVFADEVQVSEILEPFGNKLSVAAVNGPSNTVIAGEVQALEAALQTFEKQGINSHSLAVSHAFHSPLMEPILDEFYEFGKTITYHAPQVPLVSNLTGQLFSRGQIPDANYWRNHIRKPVLFASTIQTLANQGFRVFLEVGPHPILIKMAQQILPQGDAVWLQSLQRGKSDWQTLLEALGHLYTLGTPVDWDGFDKDYIRQRVPSPTYPFNRKRYWLNSDEIASQHKTTLPIQTRTTPQPKKDGLLDIPLNSFVDVLED